MPSSSQQPDARQLASTAQTHGKSSRSHWPPMAATCQEWLVVLCSSEQQQRQQQQQQLLRPQNTSNLTWTCARAQWRDRVLTDALGPQGVFHVSELASQNSSNVAQAPGKPLACRTSASDAVARPSMGILPLLDRQGLANSARATAAAEHVNLAALDALAEATIHNTTATLPQHASNLARTCTRLVSCRMPVPDATCCRLSSTESQSGTQSFTTTVQAFGKAQFSKECLLQGARRH
ncbi:unnamed protein product [Polarella glacialis]|uniref:Uncharacterized protein n=1 Tax=Polarella glacialis TaxID=89957 RepID=A0A813KD26_POLGL|nr:unnamed protein product [Polarella glacialis]